jgi:hypothetical protein
LQYVLPTSPSVGINLIFEELHFSNSRKSQGLKTNISTQIASVGLSNELAYNLTNQPRFFGRSNITAYLNWLRILSTCFYSFNRLTQWRGEIIIPTDQLSNIRLAADFDAISKQTNSTISLSKVFQSFMGSIALGFSSQNHFSIGMTLSSSLIRNPSNNSISSFSNAQVQQGAVSLKTCVDKNRNGTCEPTDPPIGNLNVTINGRDTSFKTASDGIVLIPNLFPNQPVDLSIKYSELNEPFLKWAKPGIRIFPRASKVYEATMPAVYVGAIEGRVTSESNKKPAKGLKLFLSDPAGKSNWTTRTDYEGIYAFEDIPPGDYYLGIQGDLKNRLISIPNGGAYLSGIDFEV